MKAKSKGRSLINEHTWQETAYGTNINEDIWFRKKYENTLISCDWANSNKNIGTNKKIISILETFMSLWKVLWLNLRKMFKCIESYIINTSYIHIDVLKQQIATSFFLYILQIFPQFYGLAIYNIVHISRQKFIWLIKTMIYFFGLCIFNKVEMSW